jgi:acyl-CoA synthetase (AMP-forming)/AMP-acid ligase II
MIWWMLLSAAVAYVAFAAWRLGLHRRLPLIAGRISLEEIPSRAARRYAERILFTTDEPCGWTVPALRDRYTDGTCWSAARIESTAAYLAGMLAARCHISPGERVALIKTNHLDMHVIMTGIVRAGGVACPLNDKFPSGKIGPYLAHVGARIMITDVPTLLRLLASAADLSFPHYVVIAGGRSDDDEAASRIDAILEQSLPDCETMWIEEALEGVAPAALHPRTADDVMYLVHSSGTTGFPKAVTLKNGPQSHAVRGLLSYVHLSPSRDKAWLAVPNNHQAVILTFNSVLLLGFPVHWTRSYDREGFDVQSTARGLAAGGFTGFFGFPVTYTLLKEAIDDTRGLNGMRFWAATADASHEAIVRKFVRLGGVFRSFGLPFSGSIFLDAQGSSEVGTPSVLRYFTRFTRKFGRRIGRPGSTPFGPRIRIAHRGGGEVGPGEVGRLEVKGKTVFAGYWNDPALTSDAFRDGWFFTGDVARFERDGHVVQLDREVDVVHARTGDAYTLPIEEILHKHPAIFDACAYAARQPDGSQLPAAWIALAPGHHVDEAELLPRLNAMLPEGSRLCSIEIRPWADFPMGVTGKTLKRVLAGLTEPVPAPERNRPPSIISRAPGP